MSLHIQSISRLRCLGNPLILHTKPGWQSDMINWKITILAESGEEEWKEDALENKRVQLENIDDQSGSKVTNLK